MAITVPPVRGAGDLGHVDDSNVVRQALLDLDTAGSAHYPAKGDVHGFRWDETVGRRLFAWDQVNGREQMIYGDTGWRDVTATNLTPECLAKWPNAVAYLRRVGSLVHVVFYGGTGAVTGSAVTSVMNIPLGFRPTVMSSRGPVGSAIDASSGTASPHGIYSNGSTLVIGSSSAAVNYLQGSILFATDSAWPTSLPGTAVGTIPTSLEDEQAVTLPGGE